MAIICGLACAGLVQPQIVHAETISYEFTGSWENAPATVRSGSDTLSAVWRFDINDDSPAPSNDPVDNNVVTFTAQNAIFSSIPEVCLTTGVTPPSSLSADRKTLVCNIGTRNQGTAQVSFTGMIPSGNSGDLVSVSGEFRGKAVALPTIPIMNPFVMDAKFNGGSVSTQAAAEQLVSFGWSVSHATGSLAGPGTVSYDLTLAGSNGEVLLLDGTGCGPVSSPYTGFPYSDTAHGQDQTAPFPTCVLTPLGAGKFRLTLSNLSYTSSAPTRDSRGAALPPGMDVIAAGRIMLKFTYLNPVTITLKADTPTYIAAGNPGVTSTDDATNNSNSAAYTRGVWTHAFQSTGALSQGTAWTDTYRTFAGSSVMSGTAVQATVGNANCVLLDAKYATFESVKVATTVAAPAHSGATIWYYAGTAGGLLDPSSASYDPNAWTGCGSDNPAASGWSTTPPADLSTVKAVMSFHTQALIDQGTSASGLLGLWVSQRIKSTVTVGQDIWSWGSYKYNGTWTSRSRSLDPSTKPAAGAATPGARYPYSAAGRDVLRVIGSAPVVEKEVAQKEAGPGTTVDYTLRYGLAADAGAGAPAQVVLVDSLPVGMAYVAGSSTVEPTISGTPATGQTLTWTISNVAVNKQPLDVMNFKASLPSSAVPGTVYTNNVSASSQGLTAKASAQFSVPKAGYTTLSKTSAAPVVPSAGGVAEGSWTVRMTSVDPVSSRATDTVDILPYVGDGRGTTFAGSYKLKQAVQSVAGAAVYYTTAAPTSLNEDPQDPSNGGFATTSGNTVGWSTTYTENATAVRVIGPSLAYGASQEFTIHVVTSGSKGADTLVNTAVGRASDTQLRMRTSAQFEIETNADVVLKKYVQDSSGNWHDAQEKTDFPTYDVGESVRYRLVVENIGNVDLEQLPVTDTKVDLGQFFQDGKLITDTPLEGNAAEGVRIQLLIPNQKATIEYDLVVAEEAVEDNIFLNTACVNPDEVSSGLEPSCDPAGIKFHSSFAWEKVSAHSAATFLEGSEWDLIHVTSDGGSPVAGASPISVADCVADQQSDCTGRDVDPRAGHLKVRSLDEGWYRLTETKAPIGYQLDPRPHYVQVSGAFSLGEGIVNELSDVPEIPLTGGIGAFGFWVAGGVGGLMVLAGLLWQRRRSLLT